MTIRQTYKNSDWGLIDNTTGLGKPLYKENIFKFSPRRGCPRVLKFCMQSQVTKSDIDDKSHWGSMHILFWGGRHLTYPPESELLLL